MQNDRQQVAAAKSLANGVWAIAVCLWVSFVLSIVAGAFWFIQAMRFQAEANRQIEAAQVAAQKALDDLQRPRPGRK